MLIDKLTPLVPPTVPRCERDLVRHAAFDEISATLKYDSSSTLTVITQVLGSGSVSINETELPRFHGWLPSGNRKMILN
jgi:hypothetical protein